MLKIIDTPHELPLHHVRIPAGFPSPADDYLEGSIDLVSHLVKRPAATFVMQISGDSMDRAGMLSGDYIVVDKSITPVCGHIVVAVLDGDMTVKYFARENGQYCLKAANPNYPPIMISDDNPPDIFGVVVGVVRRCV